MTRATRGLQEKAERERLMRSRDLVVPEKFYSILFDVSLWAFSLWLCAATTKKGLEYIYPNHPFIFLHFLSQGFTVWLVYSLKEIFKQILCLSEDKAYRDVISCCTAYIHRTIAVNLGKPTPYNQELARLREFCKIQYREWKLRITKRDFYVALKRKRIGHRESIISLLAFAENYYETEDKGIVEGTFPAELNEVGIILKLKVEEQSSCTEVTSLSSDEALKNYLLTNIDDSNRSSIENLSELSAKVLQFVQFSEGDRVIVRLKENDTEALHTGDYEALVCRESETGSVAFSTASLCFVHLDGVPVFIPTPVPIHLCSILDEDEIPVLALEDTLQESDIEVEEARDDDTVDETLDVSVSDQVSGPDKHGNAPKAENRARTVYDALVEGGWVFKRPKKHIKYSRRV